MMRLFCFFFLAACGVSACAQDDDTIACYTYPKTTESYKKKLWDGYEISLGRARNASGGGGDDCTAAIYNAAGKVVFKTDQAGGAHCCWIYNVVTLTPRPHKLFDIGEGTPVEFVEDKDGLILWERVGGTYEYSAGVDRPYAERAYRVKRGKLVDVTPEFCEKLLSQGAELAGGSAPR